MNEKMAPHRYRCTFAACALFAVRFSHVVSSFIGLPLGLGALRWTESGPPVMTDKTKSVAYDVNFVLGLFDPATSIGKLHTVTVRYRTVVSMSLRIPESDLIYRILS